MRKNRKLNSTAPGGRGVFIFHFTQKGSALADRLCRKLDNAVKARPVETKGAGLKKKVRALFAGNDLDILFIGATGIAVRSIAPFLKGKDRDPAVVVMDDAGLNAISLLSGHLGGANALTKKIAKAAGARPVITTATDVAGLPAIEDLIKDFDFAIENVKKIKAVNSAIVRRDRVIVVDADAKRLKKIQKRFKNAPCFIFMRALPGTLSKNDALAVVSEKQEPGLPRKFSSRALVLRPRIFFVGIGCRRGASAKEISGAVKRAFKKTGASTLCIKRVASVDIKRDERGLLAYAKKARLPIVFFAPKELAAIRPPSGESEYVRKWLGIGAVAEPAAIKSSESGKKTGRIWLKKEIHKRVTVAVARAARTAR